MGGVRREGERRGLHPPSAPASRRAALLRPLGDLRPGGIERDRLDLVVIVRDDDIDVLQEVGVEGCALADQLEQRPVEDDVGALAQKRGVEPVVDHVVAQPGARVAVDARRDLAVRPPEGIELAEAVERVGGADAVDELVKVHVRVGERALLDVAAAHRRAPREVAAQLPVAHRVVGGVVRVEGAVVGAVVLKVLHEARLPVEQLGLAEPAPARRPLLPARDLAHLAVALGQVAGHLAPGGDDGLVAVDGAGEVRAAA